MEPQFGLNVWYQISSKKNKSFGSFSLTNFLVTGRNCTAHEACMPKSTAGTNFIVQTRHDLQAFNNFHTHEWWTAGWSQISETRSRTLERIIALQDQPEQTSLR